MPRPRCVVAHLNLTCLHQQREYRQKHARRDAATRDGHSTGFQPRAVSRLPSLIPIVSTPTASRLYLLRFPVDQRTTIDHKRWI